MGNFHKYPSIANTNMEKGKEIMDKFASSKELAVVTEKLDGCNIQFIITKNSKEFQVASRTKILTDLDDLYNIWYFLNFETLQSKTVLAVLNELQKLVDYSESINTINIYGEYFGKGIQNNINYGEENYIYFFDLKINNKFVPPEEFYAYMRNIEQKMLTLGDEFSHFVAPIFSITTYEEALKFSINIPSKVSPSNDIVEGIVVRPYKTAYPWDVLKIKNKHQVGAHKNKIGDNKNVQKILAVFLAYGSQDFVDAYFVQTGIIRNEHEIIGFTKKLHKELFITMSIFEQEIYEEYNALKLSERKYIKREITKKIRNILFDIVKV